MGQIIALDSMLFIYLFESDTRFINSVEQIFKLAKGNSATLITSIISPIEVLSSSTLTTNRAKLDTFSNFFTTYPNLKILEVTWEIAQTASSLRRQNPSLKTPDSIQIATAIASNASSYITNDQKLFKILVPNLKITPLTDYRP